jgi:4-diphosphocytidyl-2-C-methyl-D-erythritol kinase
VTVRVPGKLNLQLAVGPRREDGYHDLATVFHAVSLYDDVTVEPADRSGPGVSVTVTGRDAAAVPVDGSNLAARAVGRLAGALGRPARVRVHLVKSIPVAGGLAGGSADAAGALLGYDALTAAGLGRDRLLGLAAELGSDVPFALVGGSAVGLGRGERLTPVPTGGRFEWVLGLADRGLSTAAVYAECDRLRTGVAVPAPRTSEAVVTALRDGDAVALGAALTNDLQPAACHLHPPLRHTLAAGIRAGVLGGLVSGSGPTCAFLAADERAADTLAGALARSGTCRTVLRAWGPAPGARVVPGPDG